MEEINVMGMSFRLEHLSNGSVAVWRGNGCYVGVAYPSEAVSLHEAIVDLMRWEYGELWLL